MATEAGMEGETQEIKNQVEGKVEQGEYQPNEHEIQKLKNQTVDSLARPSATVSVQTDMSHYLKNSQAGHEAASRTATEMDSFEDVSLHSTLNANVEKLTESSEGDILDKLSSVTEVSMCRTSNDNDAYFQEQRLIEKPKDITENMQKAKVHMDVDEKSKISEDLNKKKSINDVPQTQDTKKDESTESSKVSIKCQDLEPTPFENSKDVIQTEKLIASNIPRDSNECDGKEHTTDGMVNSLMVTENEQSQMKTKENENSVINITESSYVLESNRKIFDKNQTTQLVSQFLVEKKSHMETPESALEQNSKKSVDKCDSSEETMGNNAQLTNTSTFFGTLEEQICRNDDEASQQNVQNSNLGERNAENMTSEKDHDPNFTNKNVDEDVGDGAGITHTEDIIKQNTEETCHDEGGKTHLHKEVEVTYVHSDQRDITHQPKEIESSSVSEHLLMEIKTWDENRNKAENDVTSYPDRLSQKNDSSIEQGDEEDHRSKNAEIADPCTEKYEQEIDSTSPIVKKLLNKDTQNQELAEDNHINTPIVVIKDTKDEEFSKGRQSNEPQTSKKLKEENQEANFKLQENHESETSNIQEERRQNTNKDEKRTSESASFEISIQQTHKRNEAPDNIQISENHSLGPKVAEETFSVADSVKLYLEENLNAEGEKNKIEKEDQKEILGAISHVDSHTQKDDNEPLEIGGQVEMSQEDTKDDARSIHSEEVHMNNEESLCDKEKQEENAECCPNEQDSKPNVLPKEEKIINEDFKKLATKTIRKSVDEDTQNEPMQVDDGNKQVEETGARDSGNELSKSECRVKSQTLGMEILESQEENIKLLATHESADELSNTVQESQSHTLGMGLESVSNYQSHETPHVTNIEEKKRICVPASVELPIQQTEQNNQVTTEQISEDHTLGGKLAKVETAVTASGEISNKDHDTASAYNENEDQKQNLSDHREAELVRKIDMGQEKKIDSSLDVGSACTEQNSLTNDEASHNEVKEPQLLEMNIGHLHVDTKDKKDYYKLKAEDSYASTEKCSLEVVTTLSSDEDLVKERTQAQHIKVSKNGQNSNSDKPDILYHGDSENKEVPNRELLIKEPQISNKETDESHTTVTESIVTHEATEQVGNNTQENVPENLESKLRQSHESLDNCQDSIQESLRKEGDTTVSPENNIRENTILQANCEDSKQDEDCEILETDKTSFSKQDEGCEIHNEKWLEINRRGTFSGNEAPDSPPVDVEKDHSVSISDLTGTLEQRISKDRHEHDDIPEKQFHLEEKMPETHAPNIEDEEVEECHFVQNKHDHEIVGISKMTEARESMESNKYPNTSDVTEVSLEEKMFKDPGNGFEKGTDSLIVVKAFEGHIRNEIYHSKTPEKEDTQDASFSAGNVAVIDEDVKPKLVPPEHNLDVLYSDTLKLEDSLNEETSKSINASTIEKESTEETIHKDPEEEQENSANIIPEEHGNVDANKTIKNDESSVILASEQIISKDSIHIDKKAVSSEEREHEVEQHNSYQDVYQQVPDDLPASQFLLNQIMEGKLLDEKGNLKSKSELHEENQDIEQNKDDISKEEYDEKDNHTKPRRTPEDNVDSEEATNKSNTVVGDKIHDGSEKIENVNEETTRGLGNNCSSNKIEANEEMISQLSEETNDEKFNAKMKQALSVAIHSENKEDVSPKNKIHETIQELPHDNECRKNLDASLVNMKDAAIAKEQSAFVDVEEMQSVKEIVNKTSMVKEAEDPIKKFVEFVKDSNPGTKVDMRDPMYSETTFVGKLDDKYLGKEMTKTENLCNNEIDNNLDVEKSTASKEKHINIEMVEEVQGLQEEDGKSAITTQAELKGAQDQKCGQEFNVAEGLGYVIVDEQKHGKDLKNGSEEKKIAYMEEKPQATIEEHDVNLEKTPGDDLKESNLNMISHVEVQQIPVKENIQISDRSKEENLQSEQQLEPVLNEEKKHEQHVIEEPYHETEKFLEMKETKLSPPQKKHGTILSEVRSRVKHSISSVKKAITCSSSVTLN